MYVIIIVSILKNAYLSCDANFLLASRQYCRFREKTGYGSALQLLFFLLLQITAQLIVTVITGRCWITFG